ncbi:MAG: DUF4097 family beta strand repeat-containing protein [Oscillospiraceae bacterium]
MSKKEFLDELCRRLRLMPPDEAQKTVLFYSEAIDDRMEDGLSEEEAVAAMGSIDDIVREVMGTTSHQYEYVSGDGETYTAGEAIHRVFKPEVVTKLEVLESSCDVRLLPSPDGLIHVEYIAANSWQYNITEGSTLSIRRVLVKRREDNSSRSFNLFGYSINLPSFDFSFSGDNDLIIRLPVMPQLAASAVTASGDIECADLSLGTLNLKSASGDIDVRGLTCAGRISAITASGDVEITNSTCDELDMAASSGDNSMSGCRCRNAKFKTASGDVDISDAAVSDGLSASTVSGDINCRLTAPCGKSEFESLSGDISARFPGSSANYSVSAKTSSGDVHAPEFTGGPYNVRAKTSSGDIRIGFAG